MEVDYGGCIDICRKGPPAEGIYRKVGLQTEGILYSQVGREDVSIGPDFYSYREFYNKAPQVNVTLNYRFNNYNKKRNQGGEGGEDDEF